MKLIPFYIAIFAMFIIGILILLGFRLNITESYPKGLYLKTNDPVEVGSLVILCPEDTELIKLALKRGYISSGFCPGGYGYMIKKVLAAKADRIRITEKGVFVNDNMLPNSQPKLVDKSGRELPNLVRQELKLDGNSVLLMSDYNPDSFDGRYYGVTNKNKVISSIKPVWTW